MKTFAVTEAHAQSVINENVCSYRGTCSISPAVKNNHSMNNIST